MWIQSGVSEELDATQLRLMDLFYERIRSYYADLVLKKAAHSRCGKIRILERIETVEPDAKYCRYDKRSAPEY